MAATFGTCSSTVVLLPGKHETWDFSGSPWALRDEKQNVSGVLHLPGIRLRKPSFLYCFLGSNKVSANCMSPNESGCSFKNERVMPLNFQNLEENPAFVAAPNSAEVFRG